MSNWRRKAASLAKVLTLADPKCPTAMKMTGAVGSIRTLGPEEDWSGKIDVQPHRRLRPFTSVVTVDLARAWRAHTEGKDTECDLLLHWPPVAVAKHSGECAVQLTLL